jgi:hypothetical protein
MAVTTRSRPHARRLLPTLGLLGAATASLAAAEAVERAQPVRFEAPPPDSDARWLKGNTHTHTTNSDGDTPPDSVARWYRDHGYQFLVLSDHNVFTDPRTLAALVDSSFLLIPGEEVTTSYERKAVHVNALDIARLIPPAKDTSLLATVQRTVDDIRAAGAIPHINHPNFTWSLDSATLVAVRRDRLFEVFNGHPTVHNLGGGDWPGLESVWDGMLSAGKRIYGIAVDDAHHFKGEFSAMRSNPGRGWVVVRSARLEGRAIVDALERGHFYASTGPVLDEVAVSPTELRIAIRPRADFRYVTEFIGAGGEVLAIDRTMTPAYRLRGAERYVRARITESGGARAWVQPQFTSRWRARPD